MLALYIYRANCCPPLILTKGTIAGSILMFIHLN